MVRLKGYNYIYNKYKIMFFELNDQNISVKDKASLHKLSITLETTKEQNKNFDLMKQEESTHRKNIL